MHEMALPGKRQRLLDVVWLLARGMVQLAAAAGLVAGGVLVAEGQAGFRMPGLMPPSVLQEGAAGSQESDKRSAEQPVTTEEIVASTVLEPLRAGLENGSLKQALTPFDAAVTANYPDIRDQIAALNNGYSALRLRYKVLQFTAHGDKATASCEMDIDATPRDENLIALRRNTQMQLQLKHTAAGWKIVSFTPADFFAH